MHRDSLSTAVASSKDVTTFSGSIPTQSGHVAAKLVAMPKALTRIFGLLMLTGAIATSSCQAAFHIASGLDRGQQNAPQQLSPGSFER